MNAFGVDEVPTEYERSTGEKVKIKDMHLDHLKNALNKTRDSLLREAINTEINTRYFEGEGLDEALGNFDEVVDSGDEE